MKLKSFRIEYFRSIVDTGWCNLSPDNVTALIGQNEAGKTSVLEALDSFYTGEFNADYRRIGDPLPSISASFAVDEEVLQKVLPEDWKFADELIKFIMDNGNRINLKRSWTSDGSSQLALEENQLVGFFEKILTIVEAQSEEAQTAEVHATQAKAAEVRATQTAETQTAEAQTAEALATQAQAGQAAEAQSAETLAAEALARATQAAEALAQAIQASQVAEAKAAEAKAKVENIEFQEADFIGLVESHIPKFVYIEDFVSLLPDKIDMAVLKDGVKKTGGYQAAVSFVNVASIDIKTFGKGEKREDYVNLERANKRITKHFKRFWKTTLGKSTSLEFDCKLEHYGEGDGEEKLGQPYLQFWMKEGAEQLHPRQLSKGIRWFLSFFLQLQATKHVLKSQHAIDSHIYLMDEPGGSLHARAQAYVLEVLDDIKSYIQVIYTTHSPHLISLDTIWRILAVQRENEEDDKSTTQVLGVHELRSASIDTLSPIYEIMGIDLSHQQIIQKKNNVILEEISAYHYLNAFWLLAGNEQEVHFIPAKGTSRIEQLAYMFLGWGIEYIVVLDDEPSALEVKSNLRKNICNNSDEEVNKLVHLIEGCRGIEDIFTKTDFKRHVIKEDAANLDCSNSQYMVRERKSKVIAAYNFLLAARSGEVSLESESLNVETKKRITRLVKAISDRL